MEKSYEVRFIPNKKELSKYVKPLYVIEDYTKSKESYKDFQESIYTIIKGCFEIKECREYPVKFKFYRTDKEEYTMQLRHFVVNVFAWYPFLHLDGIRGIMNASFIIDCKKDIPNLTDYVNDKIIYVLHEYNVKNTILNRSVSEVLYNLRRISIDFSLIMNLTLSSETFLSVYRENDRMKKIMNTKFSLDMQPADIEKELNSLMNEEIEIFKSIPNNPVGVILQADTGIKHKQLSEFTINQGLKPDLSGVTIPIPINSSTMIRGLDKASSHYIDSLGARKSLIANKKVMGKAGYFGKVCLMLASTLSLSKEVSDCDTKHLLKIDVKNKKILSKFNGRYYKETLDGPLKLLNVKKDGHLVGKTLHFRSPVTCTCGDKVCHKCFGVTSTYNMDIADGVSGFEIEETTKVINQMILSTKHLLTTISEKIEFNPAFYDFFQLYAGEINPVLNNEAIDNLDDYAIWIDPDSLMKSEELDEDSSFNTYIMSKFSVVNMRTRDEIIIESLDEREMYLTDECLELMKKGKGFIKFKDMDETTTLFELVIMNNELTKPLYSLMALLNSDTGKETYEEMCQEFVELLVDAGIKAMSISGEVLINRLIRKDPDDDFKRPDFSKKNIGPYKILSVIKALVSNESALIGLSTQDLKKQILSDELLKKTGTSYIDDFFMPEVSTERLSELHEIVKKYED